MPKLHPQLWKGVSRKTLGLSPQVMRGFLTLSAMSKARGLGKKCLSGPACAFIGPTRDVNPSKAQGVSAPRWRALVQCRMWDWSPQYARLFKSPAGRSRLSCWAFGKIHLPKLETALHDPEEEEEARSQLEIWLPHGAPPPLVQPTARSTPPDTRVGGPDKGIASAPRIANW